MARNNKRNGRPERESGSTTQDKRAAKNGGAATGNLAINALQAVASGNLSYGYPAGTSISDLADKKGMQYTAHNELPGIAAYYITPHVGVSEGADSVINLAAKRLFTSFTYANGKNPDYQSADSIIIPLAVGQVACIYEFALRAYRVLNTFSSQNRFLPKALFESMLLDYDDFYENLADFAAWLDQYRLGLQSLYIPNNLPIIDEWRSAFRDIYVDEIDNPKAQMFSFVPRSFLLYDPAKYNTGGALIPVEFLTYDVQPARPHLYGFQEFAIFANAMKDILMYDDNVNKIMADIALSYGPESVDQLFSVELGQPIEFKYDPMVSATIHNSTLFSHMNYVKNYGHSGSGSDSREIYQVNNIIKHTPAWTATSKVYGVDKIGARLFDSPTAMVNPLLNISMSRMTVIVPNKSYDTAYGASSNNGPGFYCASGQGTISIKPASCGVYTIDDVMVYKAVKDDDEGSYSYTLCDGVVTGSNWPFFYNGYEKFKQFPLIPMISTDAANSAVTGPGNYQLNGYFGDVSYYTILNDVDLKKIHETFIIAQLSAGLKG